MEVHSNEPNIAKIWQIGSHNPAPTYCLDWSKRLHTQLKDSFFKNPSLITTAKAQICEFYQYTPWKLSLILQPQIARDFMQNKKLLQITLRHQIAQNSLTSSLIFGAPQSLN